ncbi:hypothetical protein ACFLZV_00920 [Candidatus Margulisiibacteriota bacterium]
MKKQIILQLLLIFFVTNLSYGHIQAPAGKFGMAGSVGIDKNDFKSFQLQTSYGLTDFLEIDLAIGQTEYECTTRVSYYKWKNERSFRYFYGGAIISKIDLNLLALRLGG